MEQNNVAVTLCISKQIKLNICISKITVIVKLCSVRVRSPSGRVNSQKQLNHELYRIESLFGCAHHQHQERDTRLLQMSA